MQFLQQIKAEREAIKQCAVSSVIPQQQKDTLIKTQRLLGSSYYGSKALIAAAFIGLVDWKTPKPLTQRQVPCAIGAFVLCAVADFAIHKYAMGKVEPLLVKYTGLKDGIYVNPNKFQSMRKSYEKSGKLYEQENDLMEQ